MREYKVGHTVTLVFKGTEEEINAQTEALAVVVLAAFGRDATVRPSFVIAGKEFIDGRAD